MPSRPLSRVHRGLRSYVWTWAHTFQLLALLIGAWMVLGVAMPYIMQGWAHLLSWSWPRLGLGDADAIQLKKISAMGLQISVIRTQYVVPAPTLVQWWAGALGCAGMLAWSWLLSRERLPLVYLLRIMAVLGIISLLFYEFLSSLIVNDVNRMLTDNMLDTGIAMLWLIPVVHAMVLYIFPMPWHLKLLATLTALVFICISIPLHAASLAWLAQNCSLLIAIPLFMLGSFLPQIVAQLGIYGFFMSLVPSPD